MVTVALVLMSLLVALVPVVAAAPVEIEFWHWYYPNLQPVIDEFNQKHAGSIVVKNVMVDYNEYYQKLLAAVAGGSGPDVAIMHIPMVPKYAQEGILAPIGQELARQGIGRANFRPEYVWDLCVYDGQQYGMPMGVHPMVLYYNIPMLDEAGLAGPPTSKSEFVSQAMKLTRDSNGDGKTDRWGTVMYPWWFYSASAIVQNGADIVSSDGRKVAFNTLQAARALDFLWELVFKLRVAPPPEVPGPDFTKNEYALAINGVWWRSYFNQMKSSNKLFDYGVAIGDNLFGDQRRAIWGNGHAFIALEGIKPQQMQAAVTFMDYLSQESARWNDEVPVRDKAVLSEAFRKQPELSVVLRQQIAFLPPFPWIESVAGPLQQAMEYMWAQKMSSVQALERAAKDAQVAIDTFIEKMKKK